MCRSQVDQALAEAAANEKKRRRRPSFDQSEESPSQELALEDAIEHALKGIKPPNLLARSAIESVLRAIYVEQIGYNAAPAELSLLDIADIDQQGLPKAGAQLWVDPGVVTGNRPHRGYELVLQPYMQALEASHRAHVHLRSVVFDIKQIEADSREGRPRRVVRFRTAPTPLSYMEDALMTLNLDVTSAGPDSSAAAAAGSFAAAMPPVLSAEEQQNCHEHEFDYLVCTVPVPVLAEQQPPVFTPGTLPAATWQAVRNLAQVPGKELRCFLAFRHALIRPAAEHLKGLSELVPVVLHTAMVDAKGAAVVEPWRFFVYPERRELSPLNTAPYAQIVVGARQPALISGALSWSTERLAEDALIQLRLMFTDVVVARAEFMGAISSHWLRDPFSRCSYVAIHTRTSVEDVSN
jgi:hypothetical protein